MLFGKSIKALCSRWRALQLHYPLGRETPTAQLCDGPDSRVEAMASMEALKVGAGGVLGDDYGHWPEQLDLHRRLQSLQRLGTAVDGRCADVRGRPAALLHQCLTVHPLAAALHPQP